MERRKEPRKEREEKRAALWSAQGSLTLLARVLPPRAQSLRIQSVLRETGNLRGSVQRGRSVPEDKPTRCGPRHGAQLGT